MRLLPIQKPFMVSYCQQNKIQTINKIFKTVRTLVPLFPPFLFPPVLPNPSLFLVGINFHISVPLSNFTPLFLSFKHLFIF